MAETGWPTRRLSIAELLLDEKNPRLGRGAKGLSSREIIQYLFDHDKALDVARSIATRGYFENEPLLAVRENDHYVVVEGNRRLAALKAIREPELLGNKGDQVQDLARNVNLDAIARVPVTIAPDRRATDRLLAGRHIGTPVLAWRAENRANFILSKLEEGYDVDQIRERLGFNTQDIQEARQTRAITEIVRKLDLPSEVRVKVDNIRAGLASTLKRVFDSAVGQESLQIKPDMGHGFVGMTTKKEFMRAFAHLVTDIALRKESSRTLNKSQDIRNYFKERNPQAVAAKKKGKFIPNDIISGTPPPPVPIPRPGKQKPVSKTVIPNNFKVRFGNDRLVDIRGELVKLKRDQFPNAGAVLLRVFLELSIRDYLGRTGRLEKIEAELRNKNKLSEHGLQLRQMIPEIISVARKHLDRSDITKVEKALRYDAAAPFTISELHSFVHHTDFPGDRDILQFWQRTEPLFRMMLEEEPEDTAD